VNTKALFDDTALISSLEREIFQTKVIEKIITHFIFIQQRFPVYETMWKSVLEPDRD
jgi:hypothetical protein